MDKKEFLSALEQSLSVLQEDELRDIISEYEQHIDIKVKKGLTETEAIADFGSLSELTAEILEAYHVRADYAADGREDKGRKPWRGQAVRWRTAGAALWEKVKRTGIFAANCVRWTGRQAGRPFLWVWRKCRAHLEILRSGQSCDLWESGASEAGSGAAGRDPDGYAAAGPGYRDNGVLRAGGMADPARRGKGAGAAMTEGKDSGGPDAGDSGIIPESEIRTHGGVIPESGIGTHNGTIPEPGIGIYDGAIPEPGIGTHDGAIPEPGIGTHNGARQEPRIGTHNGIRPEPGIGAYDGTRPEAGTRAYSGVRPDRRNRIGRSFGKMGLLQRIKRKVNMAANNIGKGIIWILKLGMDAVSWIIRMAWNGFWTLFSLTAAGFGLFSLYSLGVLAVLLTQGYPLAGVTLGCLGLVMCTFSAAALGITFFRRKPSVISEKGSPEERLRNPGQRRKTSGNCREQASHGTAAEVRQADWQGENSETGENPGKGQEALGERGQDHA